MYSRLCEVKIRVPVYSRGTAHERKNFFFYAIWGCVVATATLLNTSSCAWNIIAQENLSKGKKEEFEKEKFLMLGSCCLCTPEKNEKIVYMLKRKLFMCVYVDDFVFFLIHFFFSLFGFFAYIFFLSSTTTFLLLIE